MKNNKKLMFGLAISLLLGLNSCEKKENQEIVVKDTRINGVVVKNGMLSFLSQEVFNSTISKLQTLSLKEAEDIIKDYGINSLALDTVGDKEPVVNVTNPIFSRLLNSNASLIIGDKIFLLKGNNEYLINNLNFDLFHKILKSDNYFVNDDKVYTKDVSANYKRVEMGSMANTFKAGGNGGKLAYGEVFSSGQSTTVSGGAFAGIIYHYSQEFNSTGRPERVYCEISGQPTIINTSYNMVMKGEVYRRGGAFGRKTWREDALAWGKMSDGNGNNSGPYTDSNFYNVSNLPYRNTLFLKWEYKKGYADPTEIFTHTIFITN